MLLAVPKLSVQVLAPLLVTVRLSFKTTGASISCAPSVTVIVAPLPALSKVSLLRSRILHGIAPAQTAGAPNSSVPTVCGSVQGDRTWRWSA